MVTCALLQWLQMVRPGKYEEEEHYPQQTVLEGQLCSTGLITRKLYVNFVVCV